LKHHHFDDALKKEQDGVKSGFQRALLDDLKWAGIGCNNQANSGNHVKINNIPSFTLVGRYL
jgi:hypothetical protein